MKFTFAKVFLVKFCNIYSKEGVSTFFFIASRFF